MRTRSSLISALFLAGVGLAATPTSPSAEEAASITVLPGSGGAWVERWVPAPTGPPRLSEIGLPASLDPSSLRVTADDGSRELSLRLEPPLGGYPSHLQRCLGGPISVLVDRESLDTERTLTATLLRVGDGDEAVVRLEDGRLLAVAADRLLCETGDERAGERWWLSVAGAGPAGELRLVYRLEGWGWRGSHELRLGEKAAQGTLSVEALVTLPTGVNYEGVRLRLLAGDLPRVGGGPPRPMLESKRAVTFAAAESDAAPVSESRGQDLLIFDLADPVDLTGPSLTRLPLRKPHELGLEDVIRVEAPVPHHRGRDDERELAGRRHLRFEAPEGKPIPAGVVSVGQRRPDGRWLPLGETSLPRTAPGAQADLTLGEVGDLVVRWQLTSQRALGNDPYRQQVEVRIELENPRPKPALVELVQAMGGAHELVETQPAPAVEGGASATWRVELAPGASQTVRFRAKVDPRRR
jgi:hypothetical protein